MVRASCAVVSTGLLVPVSTMHTHPSHEVGLSVPAWDHPSPIVDKWYLFR